MTTAVDRRVTIDSCPHRVVRRENHHETAHCLLLQSIAGVAKTELCEVSPDACEACCQSFPPTPEAPNAVIASLLYRVAETLLGEQDLSGADRARAEQVMTLAEKTLPLSYADEVDMATWPPPFLPREISEPIENVVPAPRRRCGPQVDRWAVGVTTSPRQLNTLEYCLESLAIAGWESPRLFVDAPVPIPSRYSSLPQTLREERMGAWPSFYLGLAELAMRDPEADAYLMMQDDAVLYGHPGLRAYLESVLWPGEQPGLVSLFCSREYTQPTAGWHRFWGTWCVGALAFIFSRRAAQRFLADPQVIMHRWKASQGLAYIDLVIGRWAAENHVPVFFPTPSLVQHIGHTSTLWPRATATGIRCASAFAGDSNSDQKQAEPELEPEAGGASGPYADEVRLARLNASAVHSYGKRRARAPVQRTAVAIGQQQFPDSILVQAPAQLTYVLNGAYREFESWVAIRHQPDLCSVPAEFVVLADEEHVTVALNVVPDSKPVRLRADITGVKVLKLAVSSSGLDPCQALWLDPVIRVEPSEIARSQHDCLHRAVINLSATAPRGERCIATVASAGFENMLDEMLGSLFANGCCHDALIVVVLAGKSPACERIAAKYGAQVIQCEPSQAENPTLKSILYSIGRFVDAEQFLCLDVDTLILGDLRPVFDAIRVLPEQSILACRELNRHAFRDLKHALCTVYAGNESDLLRLQATPEEGRYPLVINDGVFAGSKAALLELDRTIRAIPAAIEWIDEQPRVTWRNQFVFNLAMARLSCGVELSPAYNVQLNHLDVVIDPQASNATANFNGQPARIVHFNGLGRNKHIEFRSQFRKVKDPLVTRGVGDQYARFLEALHRWIGRRGQSIMSWTFYGTGDGRTASIPDPEILSLLGLLHYLVRSNGYSRVLESGTGLGVSTACLASAVSHQPGGRVVTYDAVQRTDREELWQLCPVEFRNCIECRTEDALAGLENAYAAGERYDVALLDSSHVGEHVWNEFQLAAKLVKPEGLILIHDVTNEWETAGEAIPRIEAAGYGVVRLWTDPQMRSMCRGLGLALVENRKGNWATV